MQQAIRKYASHPHLQEHSITSIDAIQTPLIYLCNTDQFKHGNARALGYESYTQFLQGKVNGSEMTSWLGNSHNKTFDEVAKTLFNDDYTDLRLENAKGQIVLIQPYGFCIQLLNFSMRAKLKVTSKQTIKFLLLDPYRGTRIRADEALGPNTKLEVKDNSNENLWYNMIYTLHDDSFFDGNTCTDYRKLTTTYGECLEKAVERKLSKSYGCVPKWFPGNMAKCTRSSQPPSDDILYYVERIGNYGYIKSKCKSSCTKLEMQLKRNGKLSNYPTHSVLNLRHRGWVTVHKTVEAYDIFSLIVELGSSLGLWMGMSAVGLLDIFIEKWIKLQEAVALKTKNLINRDK